MDTLRFTCPPGKTCHDGSTLAGILACVTSLDLHTCGGPLSPDEVQVLRAVAQLPKPSADALARVQQAVAKGDDPFGEAFCSSVPGSERRLTGAFYTPPAIVSPMVNWVAGRSPVRVIDAGAGSGRFAVAMARLRPDVEVIAIDADPVATLMCRAHLALAGAKKARVIHGDFTRLEFAGSGRTAFIGNPPYVRHHQLTADQKAWARRAAERIGIPHSGLAGLHVHFFLAAALATKPGDAGCFVTSAEWLNVGYGSGLRSLLAGYLGALSLHRIDPRALPFHDAMTTALLTCFEADTQTPSVMCHVVRNAEELTDLDGAGTPVHRKSLRTARRWDMLLDPQDGQKPVPETGATRLLGSLARVSRGLATGANGFFVMSRDEAARKGLEAYARPVLTQAREVLCSPGEVRDTPERKVIIDLPPDLDLALPELFRVRQYVAEGELLDIHRRYLCAHRRPWWSVRAGKPPPIVATYMARQAPAFALNPDGLLLLNVFHGLYPHVGMQPDELAAVVRYLNQQRDSFRGSGRTYQGGLEKFEPREMEHLPVIFWEHDLGPLLDYAGRT